MFVHGVDVGIEPFDRRSGIHHLHHGLVHVLHAGLGFPLNGGKRVMPTLRINNETLINPSENELLKAVQKADPEDVKRFLNLAFYRRFSLQPQPRYVEVHPGGGAAGIRLSRFDAVAQLVRRLETE